MDSNNRLINAYLEFLSEKAFPCVAARDAVSKNNVDCFVAGNMACPKDDTAMLEFLYSFVDKCRQDEHAFRSAAIIFEGPAEITEETFEIFMWQRLQSLADKDATLFRYDNRVSTDPNAADFSFSLKEESFFIIGLHPANSRASRKFTNPVIAFNPHALFEKMRATQQYEKMKNIVRKRDLSFSGSVNPMLDDFGNSSEAIQYSGKKYEHNWQCPLKINHGKI